MLKKPVIICSVLVVLISLFLSGCGLTNTPQQMNEETNIDNPVSASEMTTRTEPTDTEQSVNSSNTYQSAGTTSIKQPEGTSNLDKSAETGADAKSINKESSSEVALVDNWSEAQLVENWSEPNLVENWSEQTKKDDGSKVDKEQSSQPKKINTKQFYGNWKLWIPGGMTDYYYKSTGEFATGVYNSGAYAGTVTVNKNGTYSMDQIVWGNGVVKGKWRLPNPGEIKHEQAIILVKGAGNSDWAVVASPDDGKINLFRKSVFNNMASWWFDTNMNKQKK